MKYTNEQRIAILADSSYVEIGLPSDFIPNDFKTLFARPLRLPEFHLLCRAVSEGDIIHEIRALDCCIDQDINELTIQDYYYLRTWFKINSCTKSPISVEWACPSKRLEHKTTGVRLRSDSKELVNPADYNVVDCGFLNPSLVGNSNIELTMLQEGTELPPQYDYPRVSKLAEMQEIYKDVEKRLSSKGAKWLNTRTMEEAYSLLEQEANLDLLHGGFALDDTVVFGIKEHVELTCQQCGSKHKYQLDITSPRFFL